MRIPEAELALLLVCKIEQIDTYLEQVLLVAVSLRVPVTPVSLSC